VHADTFRWPFFDDGHQALAAGLRRWARRELADDGAHDDPDDVDAACRTLVARLGEAGWLRAAVPAAFGGMHERLDVRSLCIARETLARRSGLADFAFAMQGLGTGPISLFGTPEQQRRWLPPVARGERIAASQSPRPRRAPTWPRCAPRRARTATGG
jgi:acyl-CoA dehydrogenase